MCKIKRSRSLSFAFSMLTDRLGQTESRVLLCTEGEGGVVRGGPDMKGKGRACFFCLHMVVGEERRQRQEKAMVRCRSPCGLQENRDGGWSDRWIDATDDIVRWI